jgi:hypothetical protein
MPTASSYPKLKLNQKDTSMITLEASYGKKIGLPEYSSHQFNVTLRTEISDLANVQAESTRLYGLLQQSVDAALQQPGFMPGSNGSNSNRNGRNESWACSPKQRDLIMKIVQEQRLDKNEVERLANERFGKAVRALNKLEASGLIEELMPRRTVANGRAGGR